MMNLITICSCMVSYDLVSIEECNDREQIEEMFSTDH